MTTRWLPRLVSLLVAALLLASCSRAPDGDGSALPELAITVFAPPSQSIWMPTLIEELKLDEKHGFRLRVRPKPSAVAYTDFATGADPVCYCAAPSAVARFVEQGADITLLWNIFNLDYFIVTNRPQIQELSDLHGHLLAADTATGGWAIAAWLLRQNGVDLDQVRLRSSSNYTASITELSVGRLDALQIGLINMATLATEQQEQGYRVLHLNQESIWPQHSDSPGIPSITFGVWRSWLADEGNLDLVRRLYRANLDAAAYIREQPEAAARLISARTSMSERGLLYLFEHQPDMIDVRPIGQYKGAIRLLTQDLLPNAGLLNRPLSDDELNAYVYDFQP